MKFEPGSHERNQRCDFNHTKQASGLKGYNIETLPQW